MRQRELFKGDEKGKRKCPHCQANMVLYAHTLGRGVVNGLVKFAGLGPGAHKLCDRGRLANGMTRNQADNFQKLRYFKLVEKAGQGEHSGIWRITKLGWDFIAGDARSPRKVWTYRGDFDHFEDDLVTIGDTKHEAFYLQFDDYVAESRGIA